MDKTSFTALAERYRDMVYRIALNQHRNLQDAEDTMQEVLLIGYDSDMVTEDEMNELVRLIDFEQLAVIE